jgi:polysaccharide chain length determinant protein (PEP-CTERM system associated)
MTRHRQLGMQDYFAMVRRRVWLIVIPTLVVPITAYLVSIKIPDRFTSKTLVLIEQQKVPDNFVKPIVTEDLTERLTTMQEQILSRTRLQPIIEQFSLFKDERASMEEKVDFMRKAIKVEPVKTLIPTQAGSLPGFYISFTTDNARTAQQVCGEITSMFMSANLRDREQSAEGTTDFLRGQLEDAKRDLDEQDAKLASFKQRYMGQLPGDEQINLNLIASANVQLEAATQALSRLEQDRAYTESLLSQQVAARDASGGASPETLEQQLATAQTNLLRLEATLSPEHPDVVKAKADVAALKASLQEESPVRDATKTADTPKKNTTANAEDLARSGEAAKTSKSGSHEPLSIQQLRAQIQSLDLAIKDKREAQSRIQKQLPALEGRLQLSPKVEEEYKKLSRNYQTALLFYNDLLTKKTQSEMATDLEKRQQGEQFRVMDPPHLPEKPTFPDRPLFALGGLGGGLVLGFGLALICEMQNKAIHNQKDVEFYLELPVLGMLPVLNSVKANGVRRWKRSNKNALEEKQPAGA